MFTAVHHMFTTSPTQTTQVDIDSGVGYVHSMDQYKEMYTRSVEDPASFWADIASEYHWEAQVPCWGAEKFVVHMYSSYTCGTLCTCSTLHTCTAAMHVQLYAHT